MTPPVRPGSQACARAFFPYALPKGLADGTAVTVEEVIDGKCAVRDNKGKVWSVPLVSLETASLVWESGQWVPE